MKIKNLSALLLLIISPLVVSASSETDRKIEDAAKTSYNYHAVLNDQVKVSAHDGVVTLTGTVQDKDEKALAQDTATNLPGVTSVTNELAIKSNYPERSDAWIALKIRGQLLVKANVSVATTTVTSQDGVVTLAGTADNSAQKELTEVYAKEIEGVKSVKNNLTIKDKVSSPSPTMGENIDDASITSQVKLTLLGHKATSMLKTKVTTTNGVIVMTGVANSEAEKSLVSKLAEGVRGVKSVSNKMTVKS